jgi:hypothetical protein
MVAGLAGSETGALLRNVHPLRIGEASRATPDGAIYVLCRPSGDHRNSSGYPEER